VRVGYAGGSKLNPTYHDLGDHTECFQLDFDPEKISYEDLVGLFWNSHNPCQKLRSTQYQSILLFEDEKQRNTALATKAALEEKLGRKIETPIRPLVKFYWAEDYHQKYQLRRFGVVAKELTKVYPKLEDFVNSTAATRLNAYLSGYGDPDVMVANLPKLGLPEAMQKQLAALAPRLKKVKCGDGACAVPAEVPAGLK
jgi:peptide-methionine (S)-S-oxide reductase